MNSELFSLDPKSSLDLRFFPRDECLGFSFSHPCEYVLCFCGGKALFRGCLRLKLWPTPSAFFHPRTDGMRLRRTCFFPDSVLRWDEGQLRCSRSRNRLSPLVLKMELRWAHRSFTRTPLGHRCQTHFTFYHISEKCLIFIGTNGAARFILRF